MNIETWDYVIVGAGAAGCVLANRLSADPAVRVLVLEAGGSDNRLWIKVPAGFTRTVLDHSIGWGYKNAPTAHVADRAIDCPRGRVLGGSSSINGHLYVRGQSADYDDWARNGATGWRWQDVLPYFKRAETRIDGDRSVRGQSGPLSVTDPRLQHPLCDAFIAAGKAMGYARNPDYNSGEQAGFGYYQYLMRGGRRFSAADAYLKPVIKRPNLQVRTLAVASKVLMNQRHATGVAYRHENQEWQARANKEVILAAGAINTPQLLQLSGIGDPDHLRSVGIETTLALPGVGQGLTDHYAVRVAVKVQQSTTLNERSHGWRLGAEVLKYLFTRRGLLSSAVAHAHGFVHSRDGLQRPDLQLFFAPASYPAGQVGQALLDSQPGMTCGVSQLRPYSRGHVRILNADPYQAPEIQPNFLADPADIDVMLAGVRFARRLFEQSGLSGFVQSESWPGARISSDEQIIDFIRNTGLTVYHPIGSCPMGDQGTPVQTDLKLRGTENLRIVDASVMPSMVSGNTYAATIMIAEKGADLILGAPNAETQAIPTPATGEAARSVEDIAS